MLDLTLRTGSDFETETVGRRLAGLLRAGDAVFLSGPLGAGKTVLARGLIRQIAGADIDVPSPTFGLVQSYGTEPAVLHADLYRLDDPQEVFELGLEDALFAGILIVEWPEKGEGYLPAGALRITATETATGREWRLEGDEAWADRLSEKDFA